VSFGTFYTKQSLTVFNAYMGRAFANESVVHRAMLCRVLKCAVCVVISLWRKKLIRAICSSKRSSFIITAKICKSSFVLFGERNLSEQSVQQREVHLLLQLRFANRRSQNSVKQFAFLCYLFIFRGLTLHLEQQKIG